MVKVFAFNLCLCCLWKESRFFSNGDQGTGQVRRNLDRVVIKNQLLLESKVRTKEMFNFRNKFLLLQSVEDNFNNVGMVHHTQRSFNTWRIQSFFRVAKYLSEETSIFPMKWRKNFWTRCLIRFFIGKDQLKSPLVCKSWRNDWYFQMQFSPKKSLDRMHF